MSSVLEKKQSATKLSDARISPLAGKPAPRKMLVDLARLEKEYFDRNPDLEDANQLVVFGTSGHRGTFPGNHAPIGGVKVVAKSGWLAARASGTESVYKIYAETFKNQSHLNVTISEAQEIVGDAFGQS
jgi:phosphoglucomutase